MNKQEDWECGHGGNVYKCQTCIWETVSRIVRVDGDPVKLREYTEKSRSKAYNKGYEAGNKEKQNKGYVILKESEIKDMLSKSEQIGYEKGWQSRKDTEGRNAGEIKG